MDPFELEVFDEHKDKEPLPIIRMVFALAAHDPFAVYVVDECHPPAAEADSKDAAARPHPGTPIPNSTFTAYDIWFGRATAGSFRSIDPQDEATFKDLLQLSHGNLDILQIDGEAEGYNIGRMLPCATNDSAHWEWMGQGVNEARPVGGDDNIKVDDD